MEKYLGFVYILSNPVFKDDVFKIGHTTRSPKDRAWEICLQVDLEFRDAQAAGQKVVVDHIGTHQRDANNTHDPVIAQEVARIRWANKLAKTPVTPKATPTAPTLKRNPLRNALSWCGILIAMFGPFILFMKFVAIPIGASIGGFLGDMVFLILPVVYFGVVDALTERLTVKRSPGSPGPKPPV